MRLLLLFICFLLSEGIYKEVLYGKRRHGFPIFRAEKSTKSNIVKV